MTGCPIDPNTDVLDSGDDDHTPIGHPADCDCDECDGHEGDDVLL